MDVPIPFLRIWRRVLLQAIAVVATVGCSTRSGLSETTRTAAVPAVITSIAMSPDSTRLATGGDDHAVRLWDPQTCHVQSELRGHTDWVHAVVFGSNGKQLYSAGADGRVLRWDLPHATKPEQILHQRNGITSMVAIGDARLVVGGFSQPVQILDLTSENQTVELPCPCHYTRALAVSPDGFLLAAGGQNGKIRIWSIDSWQVLRDIPAHDRRLRALTFTLDGQSIISGGEDRTICGWDILNGVERFHIEDTVGKVLALSMLDSHHLAAACSDNRIRVWSYPSGKQLTTLEGHTGSVSALAPWKEGLLSGGYDATVRFWSREMWQGHEEGTPISRGPSESFEGSTVR